MRLRQGGSFLMAFLMLSSNLPGSDQVKVLQVRWSGLKELIGGKKVTLKLAEGAKVAGRMGVVNADSLVFDVKKTSNLKDYPKGRIRIPRETISRIKVRGLKENKGKRIAATAGTFLGTMMGSMVAIAGTEPGEPGEKFYGSYAASIAIATGVSILVNRALRPKDITLIKILPDPPTARMPTPTNKIESSNTTASGEAPVPALLELEESSSERLRRQARRTLMQQDAPLVLR